MTLFRGAHLVRCPVAAYLLIQAAGWRIGRLKAFARRSEYDVLAWFQLQATAGLRISPQTTPSRNNFERSESSQFDALSGGQLSLDSTQQEFHKFTCFTIGNTTMGFVNGACKISFYQGLERLG